MSSLETTINKIYFKGIEILLPTTITVNPNEIEQLYKIDKYALILHLFGESLSKMANEKKQSKGKGKGKGERRK